MKAGNVGEVISSEVKTWGTSLASFKLELFSTQGHQILTAWFGGDPKSLWILNALRDPQNVHVDQ